VLLIAVLAWFGYVLIKLIGPMLAPSGGEPRQPLNVRFIASSGVFILALVILDQFLLGRFS
jgi:hypothetical protein